MKKLRNGLKRLVRRDCIVVYHAPCEGADLPSPPGVELLHVSHGHPNHVRDIEQAMLGAGEPPGLAAPRLAQGDEFFGWRSSSDAVVQSFGWMTRGQRVVASVRLADEAGRCFLYNFQTLPAFRGRGLYTALLRRMRHLLGRAQFSQLIVDVVTTNAISTKTVQHVGFRPAVRIDHLMLLDRWACAASQTFIDPIGRSLVARPPRPSR